MKSAPSTVPPWWSADFASKQVKEEKPVKEELADVTGSSGGGELAEVTPGPHMPAGASVAELAEGNPAAWRRLNLFSAPHICRVRQICDTF